MHPPTSSTVPPRAENPSIDHGLGRLPDRRARAAPAARIDEADEMPLAVLDAAHGQPMDRAGQAQTVISSTHQDPDR